MKKLSSGILIILSVLLIASCSRGTSQKSDAQVKDTAENFYQNPVLGGDYPDPSIFRDGGDYYMTHSSFDYYPGLLVWHSTDLINWQRVGHALHQYVGSVWAPDLIKHNNRYYIYFPAGGTNWVVTAMSPEGPWSDPIDLKLPGYIDPGHVVDHEGKRYLYLSKGYIVKLTEDGLATDGEPVFNYEGWEFPKEWSTECFCLESPKSTVKDGYYHLIVAEGGTAGPATSHMVVSARSTSPYGPFENSPYNPIVHTESRNERWWSQGHGTLVDDVDGNWWIMYHGYEKGFHTLGRQTLMLPIEWTADQWFRVPEGVKSEDLIRKPAGKTSQNGTDLSDNFDRSELGLQWQFFKLYEPERVELKDGQLVLQAKGKSFDESSPLLVNSSDRHYEVIVEYTIEDDVTAGLCLFYNEKGNMRIAVNKDQFTVFNQKSAKIRVKNELGSHGFLRILDDENEISFYYSANGTDWNRVERSIDATGFNHNVFGEFLSLRAGVYAFGEGKATFDNFIYRKR
ncbi:family 43 glycosylhydrolase [Gaoshiqia sediminis]|uniref:Family 43 glycosylhydrolase n=1 Tax=Gaoshiqia sediminis TaxID=2986998 RepID=A0AA41Y1S2_9BACT|nr:family 43 glycosylhydrolase [Gaoshiqia sediminis]MCW0481881.1 family 43 glycosylhydrolase [Gaoshiqia sediminis]